MRLEHLLDTNLLEYHIKERHVGRQRHPHLPLNILNYTPECTYSNSWDDVTTQTRGLIYSDEGEVISRPFRKFWNFGDERHPETLEANLPNETPQVYAKVDGSLGIWWSYGGEQGIATRGSFTSDQAVWATKWYNERYPNSRWDGVTPLFEIIYRQNTIVVNYDFEGLVLLAIVDNERELYI